MAHLRTRDDTSTLNTGDRLVHKASGKVGVNGKGCGLYQLVAGNSYLPHEIRLTFPVATTLGNPSNRANDRPQQDVHTL